LSLTEQEYKKRKEKAYLNKKKSFEKHLIKLNDVTYHKVKEVYDLLDHSFKIHLNDVHYSAKKSDGYLNPIHELAIAIYCLDLYLTDKTFITQARFKGNYGVADIIDVDSFEAIEIVFSENNKSIENKKVKYPIPIRKVNAEWVIQDFFVKRFIINRQVNIQ